MKKCKDIINQIIKRIHFIFIVSMVAFILVGCSEDSSSAGGDLGEIIGGFTENLGEEGNTSSEGKFSTDNLQKFSMYVGNDSGLFSENGDITVYLNGVELGKVEDGDPQCFVIYIDPGKYKLTIKEKGKLTKATAKIEVPDFTETIFDPAMLVSYSKGKIDWMSNADPRYPGFSLTDDETHYIILPGTESAVQNFIFGSNVEATENGDLSDDSTYDDANYNPNSYQDIIEHDETAKNLLDDTDNSANDYIDQNNDSSQNVDNSSQNGSIPGIDSFTSADYNTVSDLSNYKQMDYTNTYGMEKFRFIYPLYLYNNSVVDDSAFGNEYGTNAMVVTFTGNDGSSLEYEVSNRTDPNNINEEVGYVYKLEKNRLSDATDIIAPKEADGDRFFIVTGRDQNDFGMLVYDMVRVTDNSVYRMKVLFPDYKDETDKKLKGYYTECLYRSCGFSNSSKSLRSYYEFGAE